MNRSSFHRHRRVRRRLSWKSVSCFSSLLMNPNGNWPSRNTPTHQPGRNQNLHDAARHHSQKARRTNCPPLLRFHLSHRVLVRLRAEVISLRIMLRNLLQPRRFHLRHKLCDVRIPPQDHAINQAVGHTTVTTSTTATVTETEKMRTRASSLLSFALRYVLRPPGRRSAQKMYHHLPRRPHIRIRQLMLAAARVK